MFFAPVPYYKLNKGYFLGFLFKPRGGLQPPRGLNEKASEKYPLFITRSNSVLGVSINKGHNCYNQMVQHTICTCLSRFRFCFCFCHDTQKRGEEVRTNIPRG